MPVLLIFAIVAIVAVTVFTARGWGGQMSVERTDHVPLELGPVSATDVVLLRPPTALWGYSVQATDEALERIAESIRERDVRIVALEQLVTDLSSEPAAPPGSTATAAPPGSTATAAPRGPETGQPGGEVLSMPPERSHD